MRRRCVPVCSATHVASPVGGAVRGYCGGAWRSDTAAVETVRGASGRAAPAYVVRPPCVWLGSALASHLTRPRLQVFGPIATHTTQATAMARVRRRATSRRKSWRLTWRSCSCDTVTWRTRFVELAAQVSRSVMLQPPDLRLNRTASCGSCREAEVVVSHACTRDACRVHACVRHAARPCDERCELDNTTLTYHHTRVARTAFQSASWR